MSSATPPNSVIDRIKEMANRFREIEAEVGKVVVGQRHAIEAILNGILSHGHILLEGVPGVAKTTMIKTVAKTLGLTFNRIQFTPDLLPSDITGTMIYNPKTQEFDTKKGPIFANVILADEINRAPAKVQSALLEAMQEHQVTIGSHSYILEEPFLVLATQNPIEQEGTYGLPEAQLDRFLFKVVIDYPTIEQEKEIILRSVASSPLSQLISHQDILQAQELTQQVYVDGKIVDYITQIIFASRQPKKYGLEKLASHLVYGISPRGSLALYSAAKSRAFLSGRYYVTPDDVKQVAFIVLRHRIMRSYEAEAENVTADSIIEMILKLVKSP